MDGMDFDLGKLLSLAEEERDKMRESFAELADEELVTEETGPDIALMSDEEWAEFEAKCREERMASMLVQLCYEYYSDPVNRANYEQWYLEQYGVPFTGKYPKQCFEQAKTPEAATPSVSSL